MRILFVCVGNSCRSQMAEGIAILHGHDAHSAGTHPAVKISTHALTILEKMGHDTSSMRPKNLNQFNPDDFDLVISMGCGVQCPAIKLDDDWELEDPVGQSLKIFEKTAKEIERKIMLLK